MRKLPVPILNAHHMECEQITQPSVALQIMQQAEKRDLQQKLFTCIYSLFHDSFINWIARMYSHNPRKERVREDAKDAFQNGLTVFFVKSQQKEFRIGGSLKTAI